MKFFSSDYHSWNFPIQASPDAPLPQSGMGFSGNIFKLDQRCALGTDPGECGPEDYTDNEISNAARTNPGSWWILGEEANETNGDKTMTPVEYATYYHRMSQLVLSEDRSAKFIFGYLGQRYTYTQTIFYDPIIYTRQVFEEWKTLAEQNHWCPEPPIDAIQGNFYPDRRYDGSGLPSNDTLANPNHLFDYVHRWRDFLYDGTTDGWLANERLSISSGASYEISLTVPSAEVANYYVQAAAGRLLVPGNKKYSYLLFLMNYSGFATSATGVRFKSNQEQEACRPSQCIYSDPANGATPFGRVFGNFIYRNAGWEKQNLENWNQEDGSGATIDTYTIVASTYPTPQKTFYITDTIPFTTNVTSFSLVEFIDDPVSSCASKACWLRSDKNPVPPLAGQSQTFRYGTDYRVTNGTAKIRLELKFYDSNGVQIGTSFSCDTGFISAGNWTPFECPVGTTPQSPTTPVSTLLSIRTIPQTAGTNTKVRFDNAWGRFEAP